MHNLLTGKTQDTAHPEPVPNKIVEDAWSAEAYLAAMRRNLHAASKPGADKTTLLLAANTLALAAQAISSMPLPVKTAPKTLSKLPGDGDTIR